MVRSSLEALYLYLYSKAEELVYLFERAYLWNCKSDLENSSGKMRNAYEITGKSLSLINMGLANAI